ncbi:hypothetical protein Peur_003595 [Populus x canadensis]
MAWIKMSPAVLCPALHMSPERKARPQTTTPKQEPGASFSRQVFCGGPSKFESPEIPELNPNHVVDKSIRSSDILALAHHPSGCNYEKQTSWGYKARYRYGSLVEDYFTGSRLHSEGWRSIFCNPGGCTRFLAGSTKTVDCWCS